MSARGSIHYGYNLTLHVITELLKAERLLYTFSILSSIPVLYSGLQSLFADYSTNMVFGHQCGIRILCDVTNIFWRTEQERARKGGLFTFLVLKEST